MFPPTKADWKSPKFWMNWTTWWVSHLLPGCCRDCVHVSQRLQCSKRMVHALTHRTSATAQSLNSHWGCLATACAARPPRMSLAAAALAAALLDPDLRTKQMPDTPAWWLHGRAVCFALGFFTIMYQDLLPRTR